VKKVILFGNGQVASATYSVFTHDSPYEVAAFTVDQEYIKEDTLFGLPVVPFEDIETIYSPDNYSMFISISFRGVNKLRAEKYFQAKEKGYQLVSHISSKAIVAPELTIGENSTIGANCLIGPFVEIGANVMVGGGSSLGHHTIIKDHCFLAGSVVIAGSVTVEPYCFLGVNSTVRDRITIARECVIGAGALILEDTREKEVYIGKPADLLPISSDELPLG
jgi:sugar O-acyltransferase (sialic acid O-acetyltransferase NeuD family)